MTDIKPTQKQTFEIRPNRSLTRFGMFMFFLLVSAITLLVALRFLLLGAWLVVPFACLEVLILGVALWMFERHTNYTEVITIDHKYIRLKVHSGMNVVQEYNFQAYWAQVSLRLNPNSWYPSKLLLRSHGQSVEVGACLTEDDRKSLADELKSSLTHYQNQR